MKLLTYRVDSSDYKNLMNIMRNLYLDVLYKDNFWHFFTDPGGGTLRFTPIFKDKVLRSVKKNVDREQAKFKKRTLYSPKRHEYYGVSFLGDDILPLFHELSILCCKYPPYIILTPVFERLNHSLMIMCGVHNHAFESELYLELACQRARIVKHSFKLPKWCYKLWIKFKNI